MMRLLTGAEDRISFHFVPLSIESCGPSTVLVEGSDRARSVFWVHAWTVGSDGIITKVREYFNTSVTVTTVGGGGGGVSGATASTSLTTSVKKKSTTLNNCLPVWQSRLHEDAGKSLPGLVLAL
ncbi:uncharacterized protein M6B38_403930 [Iris pallida]|uniref:Wound-induced protein 1 n=1 Tax=Iris pallida TaxID=29817 RepID=A0AAX6FT98_IRIPA|nr:uncharacterized protein M6B38_403930 [Iris pallida]